MIYPLYDICIGVIHCMIDALESHEKRSDIYAYMCLYIYQYTIYTHMCICILYLD